MRANRGAPSDTVVIGGDQIDEDAALIKCPTCNRKFNEKAADRHIKSCADRQNNN